MAVQLIRKVRDRQPQCPIGIDWSNPLTRGLVDVIDLQGTPRSVILGTPTSYFGTGHLPSKPTRKGLAFDTTANSGGVYFQRSDGLYAPAAQTHISIAEYVTPSATYAGFFCSADGTGANNSLSLQWMDSSDCRLYPSATDLIGFSPYAVNVGIIALGLSSSSGGSSAFVAGKLRSSNAATPTSRSTSRLVLFGERSAVQTYSFKGRNLLHLFYNRVLSANEHKLIAENPWQIFEPETIPLFFSTVTAQYARPTSDVSTGTWTASSGSDLYAMLDETTASDADYIVTTGASTCEVALGSLSDPASSSGHVVRYRISADSGGITVRLRQGTTTIATWTHATAPTSLTTYEQTLTGGEADSISDYSTLRLQFEATT